MKEIVLDEEDDEDDDKDEDEDGDDGEWGMLLSRF